MAIQVNRDIANGPKFDGAGIVFCELKLERSLGKRELIWAGIADIQFRGILPFAQQ